ncbi:YlbL family protein [Paramicrobacterium agarici]|uniref:endopeptidase La n=1 Tax=Paramicrobacterium agarici TaxID=630514 RepID=A0A2A9E0C4_9MICO|nr:S16 family serine protease [Microbacterium agarici]PFG31639.1 PDZ domain-containing protein [Microbacterium agarici]
MTLYGDDQTGAGLPGSPDSNAQSSPPPRSRRAVAGWLSLAIAFVVLGVLALSPAPYVIQQPGPVFNVLGETETEDSPEPLISISGTETYDVGETLDMLTVSVVGNPEQSPNWFQIALAWFSRSEAVVPMSLYFPEGTTAEERDEQTQVMMVNSQQDAVAAALTELDVDFTSSLIVGDIVDRSPADGVLKVGDEIVKAGGTEIADVAELRDVIAAHGGDGPLSMTVVRDGQRVDLEVTPTEAEYSDGSTAYVVGVQTTETYDFPFDVSIKLNDVGGPSAGMMFALGIIDKLTPGALPGDASVAGTGTIDAEGDVGPIGGIRQKLYGASNAGADYFLAPADNCDEVVGHVPDGLEVFKVATLDDSLAVLDTLRDGGDTSSLPSCSP